MPSFLLAGIGMTIGGLISAPKVREWRVPLRTVSTVRVAWLSGDHLGSASLTTGITGTRVSELRFCSGNGLG